MAHTYQFTGHYYLKMLSIVSRVMDNLQLLPYVTYLRAMNYPLLPCLSVSQVQSMFRKNWWVFISSIPFLPSLSVL